MSVINVNLEDAYTCKTEDKNISIDVQIGDAQSGAYTIFLGQNLIATNAIANLGTKKDVQDKKVTAAAVVTDVLDETNWTSATFTVTEAGQQTVFGPYKKLVPEDHDTVIYTLQIHMA